MDFTRPIDDRAESFRQIGDVAKVIAERHCGVAIDTLTHRRWQETMAVLREVDTYADDYASSDDDVLRLLNQGALDDRYPLLSEENLGQETKHRMLDRTERILKIGRAVKNATSVDDFISLRVQEGSETALYLSDTATNFVYNQAAFTRTFEPTLRSMAVTANLLDSITDGRMDHGENKMTLEPNREYYRRLAGATYREAGLGSRALLHLPVMQEFATMSWRRLRNRMTVGRSATSSMNIFGK
jgi:hypothetical protein